MKDLPDTYTVISDLEVEQTELHSHLWTLRYPGLDGAPVILIALEQFAVHLRVPLAHLLDALQQVMAKSAPAS